MDAAQLNRWTDHYAFASPARARIGAAIDALGATAPRGTGSAGFEIALNDRDAFGVLKLIHVGDNERQTGAGSSTAGDRRVAGILAALAALGPDPVATQASGLLGSVWSALRALGLTGWYPTVGLEFASPQGALVEVSVYSHYRPAELAAVATGALELAGGPLVVGDAPFAFGFDIGTGASPRAKVYRTLADDDWVSAARGWDSALRPRTVLGLQRTLPGTTELLPELKVYAHFGDLPAHRLDGRLGGTRAGSFWVENRERFEGMVIAFVAIGSDKVEVYAEYPLEAEPSPSILK